MGAAEKIFVAMDLDGDGTPPPAQPAAPRRALAAAPGAPRLSLAVAPRATGLCGPPMLITGAVTKEEAARFFQSFGKLNAEAMFNEVDVDADGGITRREWEGFWRNVR